MLILFFFFLRKTTKQFTRASTYLNYLFLVLIAMDAFFLSYKAINKKKRFFQYSENLTKCPGCEKPNIFLIIADSYPGKGQLKDILRFDNSAFESSLMQRGFCVV